MSDPRRFEYLLNAMELSAQQDDPSKHGYASNRRAVLDYVAELERDRAALHELLDGIGRLRVKAESR